MSLHVEGQVVGPGEGAFAEAALERPIARVLPVVPRQLVGPGEFPSAALPSALVGLLARVRPEVGLEVRGFRVRLGASGVRAGVDNDPPFAPGAPATRSDRSGRRRSHRSGNHSAGALQVGRGWWGQSGGRFLLDGRIVGRLRLADKLSRSVGIDLDAVRSGRRRHLLLLLAVVVMAVVLLRLLLERSVGGHGLLLLLLGAVVLMVVIIGRRWIAGLTIDGPLRMQKVGLMMMVVVIVGRILLLLFDDGRRIGDGRRLILAMVVVVIIVVERGVVFVAGRIVGGRRVVVVGLVILLGIVGRLLLLLGVGAALLRRSRRIGRTTAAAAAQKNRLNVLPNLNDEIVVKEIDRWILAMVFAHLLKVRHGRNGSDGWGKHLNCFFFFFLKEVHKKMCCWDELHLASDSGHT